MLGHVAGFGIVEPFTKLPGLGNFYMPIDGERKGNLVRIWEAGQNLRLITLV
jgi:hypothetical protein